MLYHLFAHDKGVLDESINLRPIGRTTMALIKPFDQETLSWTMDLNFSDHLKLSDDEYHLQLSSLLIVLCFHHHEIIYKSPTSAYCISRHLLMQIFVTPKWVAICELN